MKCVNIKLWDILGFFRYILSAPRKAFEKSTFQKSIDIQENQYDN